MSDVSPEQYAEFTTQDGPGSADAGERPGDPGTEHPGRPGDPAVEHPEQEAHGGSMAPGLVDDSGHRTAGAFPGEKDQ